MKTSLKPIAAALGMAAFCSSAVANPIISEYLEGASFDKAIELYNPTSADIDLADYRLDFYFNGNTSAATKVQLEGTLSAQGVFVVAHRDAKAAILDAADQISAASWFNGDDAIVLVHEEQPVDSIGQVGFDPGSQWGQDPVSTQNNGLRRVDGSAARTDINSSYDPSVYFTGHEQDDFSDLGFFGGSTSPVDPDPDPQPTPTLTCGEPSTAISAIQGNASSSPLTGQVVVVEAVVTGDFQESNQLKGFFVQSLNSDADPLTSEGVFVYHSADDVAVGDVVRFSATVDEYYDATQLSDVTTLKLCDTAPVTPVTLTLPLDEGVDLEAYEGMLVKVEQTLHVVDHYNLARFGEVGLATERLYQGTQVAAPGADALAVEAQNARKELLLDDGSTVQNPEIIPYPSAGLDANQTLRLGDTVNSVTGVLGYSFSKYRLHPTQEVAFVNTNKRTESPSLESEGDIKVASFNVLNYFNGDGQQGGFPTERGADSIEEFVRQEQKIVTAISALDADVIGLMEIENDGFDQYSAVASLVNALNSANTNAQYAFVDFNTAQVGTDAITTAIIYRADRVEQSGIASINDQGAFAYGNRAAIAQSFTDKQTQEQFTVAVAHLKSKGGCSSAEGLNQDQNDGQGCHNATRVAGATEFANWLNTYPTGVEDDDIILVGDLNAYAQEDPIQALADAGFSNVFDKLDYSYHFQGRLGSLDHAVVTPSLSEKLVAATHWAINADEPRVLDYNVEFKTPQQQASLYDSHAYRASDHDPLIVAFAAQASEPEVFEGEYTGLSGWFWPKNFTIDLPQGYDNLTITLEDGYGQADLYASYKRRPSIFRADCKSRNWGSDEQCTFEQAKAGKYKVRIAGILPYYNVTLRYRATKSN